VNIRTARIETDLVGIVRVCNACDPDHPTSMDNLLSNFLDATPGRVQRRLVAVDEKDAVKGYSLAVHLAEAPAHHFYVWLGVEPSRRGQGTGSALWKLSLEYLQTQAANRLSSDVFDTDPVGLGFAQRRGFTIDRQHFSSILDLHTFNENLYLGGLVALETQGIRFCSLADLPDTPAVRQQFYALNLSVVRDIPGEDWNFDNYPGFFKKHILGSPRFRREDQLLAVSGEELIGFTAVSLFPENQNAWNATTGVIRSYRGRKIALALKVLAARYARLHGARTVQTDNDSLNAPILTINRRMGYRPQPGTYQLVCWLRGTEQE
jgi:GNAT superfamily N-acetyltransferase